MLQSTVKPLEHPSSINHLPEKRFRLPFPKKACTPRLNPGCISLIIDRFLSYAFRRILQSNYQRATPLP